MAAHPMSLCKWIISRPFVLFVILALPAASMASHTEITIMGKIRGANGAHIPMGVMVYLKNIDETPVASRPADSEGNFEFDDIAPGAYSISINANQFEPFTRTLDLNAVWAKVQMVNIVLIPVDQKPARPEDLPSLTEEALPKSARKEFEKGGKAFKEKKYTEARAHLEKALVEFPCYARAVTALAQVDLAENKKADAEIRLKKAVECDGTYMNSFSQLAQLYMEQGKSHDSEEVLLQGLRLSPSSWILRYQLGTARIAMGKYAEAEKDLVAARSLHPDMPGDFFVQLANAYLKTGDKGKALAEITTYLRLEPEGKYSDSAKQISQTLRNQGVVEPKPE